MNRVQKVGTIVGMVMWMCLLLFALVYLDPTTEKTLYVTILALNIPPWESFIIAIVMTFSTGAILVFSNYIEVAPAEGPIGFVEGDLYYLTDNTPWGWLPGFLWATFTSTVAALLYTNMLLIITNWRP